MSLENPGQVPCGVKATGRPSGSVIPLAPVQVMRRVADVDGFTSASPSCSWNSGSTVISAGDMVVNIRVKYGQVASKASACRAGSMMREARAEVKLDALHWL